MKSGTPGYSAGQPLPNRLQQKRLAAKQLLAQDWRRARGVDKYEAVPYAGHSFSIVFWVLRRADDNMRGTFRQGMSLHAQRGHAERPNPRRSAPRAGGAKHLLTLHCEPFS